MNEEYEVVFNMTDYWDGPRAGVANFMGRPHFYQSLFDEKADDWSDTFVLTPIDEETFKLELEDWEIWKRWEHAWRRGQAPLDSHPALPEDKARYEEIAIALKDSAKVDSEVTIRVKADFERGEGKEPIGVRWIEISGAA